MNRRITLKTALDAWGQRVVSEAEIGKHTPSEVLDKLAVGSLEREKREEILKHIVKCAICLRELKRISQSIGAAESLESQIQTSQPQERVININATKTYHTLRKAAADSGVEKTDSDVKEIEFPQFIHIGDEEGEIGVIEIRQSITNESRGLITVRTGTLEGQTVKVMDRHRILLEGEISGGEVSQRIDELNRIDLGSIKLVLSLGVAKR